jgi:hypothetical protein
MLAACTGGIHRQATSSLQRANSCFASHTDIHKNAFRLRPARKLHNNNVECHHHHHRRRHHYQTQHANSTGRHFGTRNVFGWAKLTSATTKPPVARRESGGGEQDDPYDWLRTGEEREIRQYLVNENTYAQQELRASKKFEKVLFHEMEKRVAEKEEGVPELLEGWYYYMRTNETSSFPIYCR